MTMDLPELERLAKQALQKGATQYIDPISGDTHFRHIMWDVAGVCKDPFLLDLSARKYVDRATAEISSKFLWIQISVKCRTCSTCLHERRNQWGTRGVSEFHKASRVWFGTLTFDAEAALQLRYSAITRLEKSGTSFVKLTTAEQFHELEKQTYREMSLWLKRLRKETKAKYRFLAVGEPHKSGVPHYHILIYEQGSRIKKRTLKAQWTQGFTKWKVADTEDTVWYVCKYLTKSESGKVRASIRFGKPIFEENLKVDRGSSSTPTPTSAPQ